MLRVLRHAVSENRRRYVDPENGFDLDLSYITDRVIAMGLPSQSLESYYRNPIYEVRRFLDMKHLDHYKVYNLCSERTYEVGRFGAAPVARFPFDDHNPPPFEILNPFCRDVTAWLEADLENVAVIHCKAGKGRTGLCVCVFLLYSGLVPTAVEALKYYGGKRTWNGEGVTIPSQVRYIHYFEKQMAMGDIYQPRQLALAKIIIHTIPKSLNSYEIAFSIYHNGLKIYSTKRADCYVERQSDKLIIKMAGYPAAAGDVKVVLGYNDRWGKHLLCHFWFNTTFEAVSGPPLSSSTPTRILVFKKSEIDRACKDKYNEEFEEDFKVTVVMGEVEDFGGG